MKVQAQHTETQIKKKFKKLHQFLEEEEEARMAALREEEEQKRRMMEEKMEAVSREIAALSHTVRATEEELRAEDVSFLHNYKAALQERKVETTTLLLQPADPPPLKQPVCLVCRDSRTHTNHRFRPIDEAAQDLREELQKSLQPFQEKLKLFEEVQVKFDQTAGHMKVQAQHTETQIKEQFKKLHQFLEEEEEARMAALREEEEQKRRMMRRRWRL
ncbi:hypothetical protein F7725_016360 [Dissostichus mawsoni]|uniref:Uncharacterized protein n=1 Tax=Dissostichus mawsoni TaxID=36200 RepID=A0A7J5Z4A8_DISMA|nr:hypothetical protein F7725_016360 [Dissostichus mawsoni]